MLLVGILFCGTFTAVKVKGYIEQHSFTKEKWVHAPDKRFMLLKDLLRNNNFYVMTKDQVINLLGEPDNPYKTGGFAINASNKDSKFISLDDKAGIYYFTRTGEMPEDFEGLYIEFDKNDKFIKHTIIHFTT